MRLTGRRRGLAALNPAGLLIQGPADTLEALQRQDIDSRLATLTTLAKAGQASWCSPGDWIQGGAR
jgi:hypothetical protein